MLLIFPSSNLSSFFLYFRQKTSVYIGFYVGVIARDLKQEIILAEEYSKIY
jgi:hypothetical protein